MTNYFDQLSALSGASDLDKSVKDAFLSAIQDQVIPAIVIAEEKQRLLAAEVRTLPTKRVNVPED